MKLKNSSLYNVNNAINTQNSLYQRIADPNKPIFPTLVELQAQSIQAASNTLRNTFFEIPGPWGSTPGPRGTAGSPTVGALQSPPKITNTPNAGF
jgi:hypothetical protein